MKRKTGSWYFAYLGAHMHGYTQGQAQFEKQGNHVGLLHGVLIDGGIGRIWHYEYADQLQHHYQIFHLLRCPVGGFVGQTGKCNLLFHPVFGRHNTLFEKMGEL
jgi:hypothetical protein